ncbi:MAG: hypothetical protein Q4D79_11185 [Propionibacteriaceae bacterium]|nr:hypothetical protein [Propionibacteriaceae bacterium]
MRAALNAEARKIGTLPPLWWAAMGAVGATIVVARLLRNAYPDAAAVMLADLARGLVQAGPLAVGAVLGAAERRQLAAAWIAVPRRAMWLAARWLGALLTLAAVAALVTLASRAPLGADGQWWGTWAWLWGVALAGFLLADLTDSAIAAAGVTLSVLWVAPIALQSFDGATRWLPDATPLAGWAGVHPTVAAAWLGVASAVTLWTTLRACYATNPPRSRGRTQSRSYRARTRATNSSELL